MKHKDDRAEKALEDAYEEIKKLKEFQLEVSIILGTTRKPMLEEIGELKHRADVAEEALGKVQATALSILHANSYDVDVLLKRAIKAGVKVDDLLCSPKCNRAKQYEDDLQKAEQKLKGNKL